MQGQEEELQGGGNYLRAAHETWSNVELLSHRGKGGGGGGGAGGAVAVGEARGDLYLFNTINQDQGQLSEMEAAGKEFIETGEKEAHLEERLPGHERLDILRKRGAQAKKIKLGRSQAMKA